MRWWDIPAVMELEVELFGDESWSAEAFWSELAYASPSLTEADSRRYWVAAEGDENSGGTAADLLGYAGVAVGNDEAYVQTIGVARRAQRQGLGSLLMRQLLADARAAGDRTCWLEVRADNAEAQAMYAGFGFVPRGRRRGYYQPSGVDAIVMAADLQAGTPRRAGSPA
jgi:ribosomal-protein-alanine N-acetyltransferase